MTLAIPSSPSYKRVITGLVLVGVLALAPLGTGTEAARANGGCALDGAGTSADPWLVSSPTTLSQVGVGDCTLGGEYRQTSDILLPAAISPLAPSVGPKFLGTYDGDDHTITGLTLVGFFGTGLFGQIGAAGTVKDLVVDGASVTGGPYVGILAGVNEGSILNVRVSGRVDGINDVVGGIVGGLKGTISDSSAAVTVVAGNEAESYFHVGGLAGFSDGGTISHSSASGNVTGGTQVGGLVGTMDSAVITKSYATGAVNAFSDTAGGLVGAINFESSDITYSYASGAASSAGDNVGGLIGDGTLADIDSSYATGDATGSNNVGGLAGSFSGSGSIHQSYSIGAVRATTTAPSPQVGGFLGREVTPSTPLASFWDTETSGYQTSAGTIVDPGDLQGKTTAQMRTLANYTDPVVLGEATWPIVAANQFSAPSFITAPTGPSPGDRNIWGIGENVNSGYPFLWWQEDSAFSTPAQTQSSAPSQGSRAPALHMDLKASVGDNVLGAPVLMEGHGLAPGSAYSLVVRSTPITVKSGSSSAGGLFSHTVRLPAGIPAGLHTLILTGIGANGETLVLTQSFTVGTSGTFSAVGSVSGQTSRALAATGPNDALLLAGASSAALLIFLGVLLASITRSRALTRR
jgi:hypothetical protein